MSSIMSPISSHPNLLCLSFHFGLTLIKIGGELSISQEFPKAPSGHNNEKTSGYVLSSVGFVDPTKPRVGVAFAVD